MASLLTDLWEHSQDFLGIRRREFQQALEWSIEARALLDNPMLQRFFSETEKNLLEQWMSTKPDQKREREVAYQMLLLSRKFKTYLESFLASEEYARQQLEQIDKDETS